MLGNLAKVWKQSGFFRAIAVTVALVGTGAIVAVGLHFLDSSNPQTAQSGSSNAQTSTSGNPNDPAAPKQPLPPGPNPSRSFPSAGTWDLVDPKDGNKILLRLTFEPDGQSYSDGVTDGLNKTCEIRQGMIYFVWHDTSRAVSDPGRRQEYMVGKLKSATDPGIVGFQLLKSRLATQNKELEFHYRGS